MSVTNYQSKLWIAREQAALERRLQAAHQAKVMEAMNTRYEQTGHWFVSDALPGEAEHACGAGGVNEQSLLRGLTGGK